MKGQISLPSTAVASAFITLLLLSLTLGNTSLTNDFIKTETLDVQADRVVNGLIGMESLPKGYIQMEMEGYGFKIENNKFSMNYSGANATIDLENEPIQSQVKGSQDYQNIDQNLCIRKEENQITVQEGEC